MMDHITHLEDLIFEGPIFNEELQDFVHTLALQPLLYYKSPDLSLKIDGSPAVIAGCDDEGIFVGLKSALHNEEKRYRGKEYPSTMSEKFKELFEDLYKKCDITVGDVFQIDVVCSPHSDTRTLVPGRSAGAAPLFHPNTIVYEVPGCHAEWVYYVHTRIAPDGKECRPTYSPLTESFYDLEVEAYWNARDKTYSPPSYSNTKKFFDLTESQRKAMLTVSNRLRETKWHRLSMYQVQQQFILEAHKYYSELADKLKTEDGKSRKMKEYESLLLKILYRLDAFQTYLDLIRVKRAVINSLNKTIVCDLKPHILRADEALEECDHEGYVFRRQGITVKLVDRTKFSSYNFSDKIKKGWER